MTRTPTSESSDTIRSSSSTEWTTNDNLIVIGVSPAGRTARLSSSLEHTSIANRLPVYGVVVNGAYSEQRDPTLRPGPAVGAIGVDGTTCYRERRTRPRPVTVGAVLAAGGRLRAGERFAAGFDAACFVAGRFLAVGLVVRVDLAAGLRERVGAGMPSFSARSLSIVYIHWRDSSSSVEMTDIWTPWSSSSSASPLAAAWDSFRRSAAASRAAFALRMSLMMALNSAFVQPSGRRGLRPFPFDSCAGAAAAVRLGAGLLVRVGACLAAGLRAGDLRAGAAGLLRAGDLPPVSFSVGTRASFVEWNCG